MMQSNLVMTFSETLNSADNITLLVKYKNTTNGPGSLLSVSDTSKNDAHFHLYQSATVLDLNLEILILLNILLTALRSVMKTISLRSRQKVA